MNKKTMTDALEYLVDLVNEWNEGPYSSISLGLTIFKDGSGVLGAKDAGNWMLGHKLNFYHIEELTNYLAEQFDWDKEE